MADVDETNAHYNLDKAGTKEAAPKGDGGSSSDVDAAYADFLRRLKVGQTVTFVKNGVESRETCIAVKAFGLDSFSTFEPEPDAWQRFVSKSPPQHRAAKKSYKKAKAKKVVKRQ